MNEKQELIRALQERGLTGMVIKAKAGDYSHWGPYPDPMVRLVEELEALGHHDLAERAKNGDFDHER